MYTSSFHDIFLSNFNSFVGYGITKFSNGFNLFRVAGRSVIPILQIKWCTCQFRAGVFFLMCEVLCGQLYVVCTTYCCELWVRVVFMCRNVMLKKRIFRLRWPAACVLEYTFINKIVRGSGWRVLVDVNMKKDYVLSLMFVRVEVILSKMSGHSSVKVIRMELRSI